jgi:hypothetical protein
MHKLWPPPALCRYSYGFQQKNVLTTVTLWRLSHCSKLIEASLFLTPADGLIALLKKQTPHPHTKQELKQ